MPKFMREQPSPSENPSGKPVVKCPDCKAEYYGDPPEEGDPCPECGHLFKGPER